jgi:hypothetical protein
MRRLSAHSRARPIPGSRTGSHHASTQAKPIGHMVNPQRGTEPSTEDPRETPSLHRAGQADRRSNSLISLRGREPKEVPQTTLAAQHCRVYGKVPVFWHESRGACLGGSARDSEFANSLLQGGSLHPEICRSPFRACHNPGAFL